MQKKSLAAMSLDVLFFNTWTRINNLHRTIAGVLPCSVCYGNGQRRP
jgi:hypothetical protein